MVELDGINDATCPDIPYLIVMKYLLAKLGSTEFRTTYSDGFVQTAGDDV